MLLVMTGRCSDWMQQAADWADGQLLASDLRGLLSDVRAGRVRYCGSCSRFFGLPWSLEYVPESADRCRMCGRIDSNVLAIPVWELQARLMAQTTTNQTNYLDDSLAFVITEMP